MDLVIIDDEPKIRNGLSHMLARHIAWNVVATFEDAISALEYLDDHHVDVIITDIKMPEMNGLEMIARLREKNLETYVIIISGYGNFQFAQQAIELGVFRYMLKPTNPRELIQVLEKVEELRQKKEDDLTEEKVEVGNLLVMKAVEYIEKNYACKISVKDIASHLYVTPNYLSNLFKQHTGENISTYITDYRLKKSRDYLKRPEYSIAEIAELIGIGNARYFSNIFKKKYGQTPSEYRNKMN
ncbi:MAG: response regulator [Lachnospiraceae bacterium]|nr:response regulator [Lachnospiraceae bacterium]MDD6618815.1 response regulator [Clostridiales bacterium]